MPTSTEIINQMLAQDAFSQWLGIEILDHKQGYCKVGMTIRPEMLNGMNKAHGGITFSLADSCFAFASNSHGRVAVSIEASINHIKALEAGDYITAETILDHLTNKLGYNVIEVRRGEELVALFKGIVYRTQKDW
ncbi:MAG: hotdog fold thioesterase [Bacteroidota bacterium]